MIKEVEIKDKEEFYLLGELLNNKFNTFFTLEEIINNNNDYLFGYYINNRLIAFIHITKSYEVLDINNIIVNNKYQRKNIGTKLIEYTKNYFNDIKEIILEVRSNNKKAIDFYKKNNFEIINIRKNYYDNDDAYIMKRDVI